MSKLQDVFRTDNLSVHQLNYIDSNGCPRRSFYLSEQDMLTSLELGQIEDLDYIEDSSSFQIKDQFGLTCLLNSLEESLI